ncbi:MAG: hypothetical protein JW860_01800 [Sedimentisphaerales bacterium]|nr:hypothetical protein [Sedimentisphaerales bacterium]
MSRRVKRSVCLLVVIFLFYGGLLSAETSVCPDADVTDDCWVGLEDFALFASQWLAGRVYCAGDREDCDGWFENGCETDIAGDPNNCSACGYVCNLSHATAGCEDANCVVLECQDNWDDCDEISLNGCEVDLDTDPDNCGTCDYVCNLPHAINACEEGECTVGDCQTSWGDCDEISSNGCEVNVWSDVDNCGSCGNECDLPNAVAECLSGYCFIDSCYNYWADCDGNPATGCEFNLRPYGSCASATSLGSVCGDDGCYLAYTRYGHGEQWFEVYVEDCDAGQFLITDEMKLRVELDVPATMDYDIVLYNENCSQVAQTYGDTGVYEILDYSWDDDYGINDSRWMYIKVEHYGGTFCADWILKIRGDCP